MIPSRYDGSTQDGRVSLFELLVDPPNGGDIYEKAIPGTLGAPSPMSCWHLIDAVALGSRDGAFAIGGAECVAGPVLT